MEQKISNTLDLKYRLRAVRDLALKLHYADQALQSATLAVNAAREQADLYCPELDKPLPAAFDETAEVLFVYRNTLRQIRHGLQCLRERCFDSAVDFQNRLVPILVGPWVREFPRIGDLPSADSELPLPTLEESNSSGSGNGHEPEAVNNEFLRIDCSNIDLL